MKLPKRVGFRRIPPGRAVFNAASELCRRIHPKQSSTGNSCCGQCHEIMAFTLNNPLGKRRVRWWSDFVAKHDEDEFYKVDYALKGGPTLWS